jgi:hypothetical protein
MAAVLVARAMFLVALAGMVLAAAQLAAAAAVQSRQFTTEMVVMARTD